MPQMLELFQRKHEITMINMLKALKEKMNNMQHQIGKFKGEMEIIQKNQIEMLRMQTVNGD